MIAKRGRGAGKLVSALLLRICCVWPRGRCQSVSCSFHAHPAGVGCGNIENILEIFLEIRQCLTGKGGMTGISHLSQGAFRRALHQGPRSNVGTLMSTVSTLGVLTLALILLLAQCANTF